MPAIDQSRLTAIDFERDVTRLTQDFTGRDWFFGQVDQWLHAQEPRFFILTGEPGVGKSAIAARLTQVRNDIVAYHFCIAGRSSTVRPATVFRSIAAQLGKSLPGYGVALANTIKPIHLSVQVDIDVQKMTGGEITGVVIEHLHASNVEEEMDILLRAPLAILPAPSSPALILVDSLDESVTYQGDVNLVTLLAKVSDLPSWVRFLCTTRPEQRVLRDLSDLAPYVLAAESQMNLNDIRQYVVNRTGKKRMGAQLGRANVEPQTLADRVTDLSTGNFLYTKILLDDIEAGRQPLDDLSALPKSLDEVYHSFLRRFTVQDWEERYQPIFSILAVAREPLTETQLAGFVGLGRTKVRQYLGVVQQFLDEAENRQGTKTFALFHQSMRDYLLDETRNQDFWCAPEEGHQSIADYYLEKCSGRWEDCAPYGLRYTATHLAQAARTSDQPERHQYTERLVKLVMDAGFQQAHQRLLGDLPALQHDLKQALASAANDSDSRALPLVVKMALAFIAFRRERLQPMQLFDLARTGDIDSAEERLSIFPAEPRWRQAALLSIAWLAWQKNPDGARKLRDRIASDLSTNNRLPLLLERLDADLENTAWSPLSLPNAPPQYEAHETVARLGGFDPEESSMLLQPWHWETPPILPHMAENPVSGEIGLEETMYVAERDGLKLVAYAVQEPVEGTELLKQYLSIHAANNYEYYRNVSLWALMEPVLRHPDQAWVREMLPPLLAAALAGGNPEFQEGVPIAILALQAQAGKPGVLQLLKQRQDEAVAAAQELSPESGGDSWSGHKRQLTALAEAFATVLNEEAKANSLLHQALELPYGFAGFQSPACLTLVEALLVCCPQEKLSIKHALNAALVAAHNVQEATFCARTVARFNAMNGWMGMLEGGLDTAETIEYLYRTPFDFGSCHEVGEDYRFRLIRDEKSPLPAALLEAHTLEELANAYQFPLNEFLRLNRANGWKADEPLYPRAQVNVPDPEFPPLLAARLAAEAMADDSLAVGRRVALIQSLVPVAAANPTALDTVLYRLLLAAAHVIDLETLDTLTDTIEKSLGEDWATKSPIV